MHPPTHTHARTQVVLAGGFCFQMVDRLAGGTFNIAQPAWVYVWVYEPLIARTMGLWFLFNMIWLFVCGYSLLRSLWNHDTRVCVSVYACIYVIVTYAYVLRSLVPSASCAG